MKELKTKRPKVYFVQLGIVILMFSIFNGIFYKILNTGYVISGMVASFVSYVIFLGFLKIFKKENYLIKKY